VGSLHIAYEIKGSQQNPEQGTAGYETRKKKRSSQRKSGTILTPSVGEAC